ncbi:hypothetical protein ACT2CV_05165 [Pasteurellaceae bacterium 22721_9_1]
MKFKSILLTVLLLSACSNKTFYSSFNSIKSKVRDFTSALNYKVKTNITDTPQQICKNTEIDYTNALITITGTPIKYDSPEFLIIVREYSALFPGDYIQRSEYQKRARMLLKLDDNTYVIGDFGKIYDSFYSEWAKEKIEKQEKIEVQGIISEIERENGECFLIFPDAIPVIK